MKTRRYRRTNRHREVLADQDVKFGLGGGEKRRDDVPIRLGRPSRKGRSE